MNVKRFIPTSRKNKIIIISISLIILIAIILLSIAGANYAKCGEFKLKCTSSKQSLDKIQEDLIKEDEEEMERLAEGKMCNFVNIKDVTPSPDKDGDGSFDSDESIPCEKCDDYKLNGVKMTPFIKEIVEYKCINEDDEDDDCEKEQVTVLDDIGMCRASLLD